MGYRSTQEYGNQSGTPTLVTMPSPESSAILGLPEGSEVVFMTETPGGVCVSTHAVDAGFLDQVRRHRDECGEDLHVMCAVILLADVAVPDTVPTTLKGEGDHA